jgi:LPS O-antigen subunit length determinant protein (WzzB/FepE family)
VTESKTDLPAVPEDRWVDDEIDLRELFARIWAERWTVIGSGFVATVLAVALALWLPNIYRSEVLLAPAEESSGGGLSALASQFGGLASLAGISLPKSEVDKTTVAMEVLKSRAFLTRFIREHHLEVPLMAAKGWDRESDRLVIDDDIYDPASKTWVRDVDPPKKPEPSDWELYEAFKDILGVSQDKNTGLITVSVEFYSPEMAKQWVDQLIVEINQYMKERDVADASKQIAFLKEQIDQTSIADMQKIFYSLIEQQTKVVMLAQVRDEYVFKTLDPAVVPEEKAKPKRALIVVLGAMLGGMLGIFIALFRRRDPQV